MCPTGNGAGSCLRPALQWEMSPSFQNASKLSHRCPEAVAGFHSVAWPSEVWSRRGPLQRSEVVRAFCQRPADLLLRGAGSAAAAAVLWASSVGTREAPVAFGAADLQIWL